MLFLWLKAFHIIAIVCWFAALFYLPRLFVYHAMAEDQASTDRFKVMERKLYRGIATPSMIASLLLGAAILWVVPGYLSMVWMHIKLVLVGLLIIYHFLCRKHLRELAEDRSYRSHIYFRWFNEVPVFMLVGIVVLVVVRPF